MAGWGLASFLGLPCVRGFWFLSLGLALELARAMRALAVRALAEEEGAGQSLGRREVGRCGKFGAAEFWSAPLSAGSLELLPALESRFCRFG